MVVESGQDPIKPRYEIDFYNIRRGGVVLAPQQKADTYLSFARGEYQLAAGYESFHLINYKKQNSHE